VSSAETELCPPAPPVLDDPDLGPAAACGAAAPPPFAAYDALPAMVQALDRQGCLRHVNRAWLARLGYRPSEVVGRPFATFLASASRLPTMAQLSSRLARREACEGLDCVLVARNGGQVAVRLALQPLAGAVGRGPVGLAVLTETGELEQAKARLAACAQQMRELLAATAGELWEMDENFRFTFVAPEPGPGADAGAGAGGGLGREEPELWCRQVAQLRSRRPFREVEYTITAADGTRRHRRVSGTPIVDDRGRFRGFRGIVRDVSEPRRLAQQLAASKERLDLALESAGAGLFDVDFAAGRISYNDRAALMLGYPPGRLPTRPEDLLSGVHPDDRAMVVAAYEAHLRGERALFSTEHRERTSTGGHLWIAAMGRVVARDAAGRPCRLTGLRIDISERKRAQLAIEHLALHDALTDLPNRAYFNRELERVCAMAARRALKLGLLFLDLDRFKEINDTYGHAVGDALLIEAARRLQRCVRKGDLVARLGGDEFAILAVAPVDREDCGLLARRVLATIDQPFEIDGLTIQAGISIGGTLYPDDGTDLERLMGNADMALYAAKAGGRRAWRAFDRRLPASRRRPSPRPAAAGRG
jgi:diguanylate cyclase (GGDEF)-like protein/PAS domain S-box-containing protein